MLPELCVQLTFGLGRLAWLHSPGLMTLLLKFCGGAGVVHTGAQGLVPGWW